MPHFWIPVPANPKRPKRMRDETKASVRRHHGRLLNDELFFRVGDCTVGHATVECSEEAIRQIADDLNTDYERVLTADEAEEECPHEEGEEDEGADAERD